MNDLRDKLKSAGESAESGAQSAYGFWKRAGAGVAANPATAISIAAAIILAIIAAAIWG
jgi:hypothetical protein